MTAPHGLSADRFRFGQPVVATAEHYAETMGGGFLLVEPGDVGEISYFWSDGRFAVTWERWSSYPTHYKPARWPSPVGPAPVVADTEPPPAPDSRLGQWDKAIDQYFDQGKRRP